MANNYQFQAQQLDPESNLYYLRARYYDPSVGRFISRDPVKGSLATPQSQNPYAYAFNNPVNLSDPSGENPLYGIAQQCLPIAGKIWGYTQHGLNQAIGRDGGRGVSPGAILNAVKDPIKVLDVVDDLGRESVKYVGENAVVVLNKAGEVVTTWATSVEGLRGF